MSDARWDDPREYGGRDRDEGRARVYGERDRADHDPRDGLMREVAIAGRSNAGKSSAINAIVDQNALARTSKTPGRTQQLVYFEVAPGWVWIGGGMYAPMPPQLNTMSPEAKLRRRISVSRARLSP